MKDHPDIDLIITDFNMPNMDGLTMIESIRNDMRNTEVKIIVLTTEDCADLKERGRSLGITGWVVKPITPEVVDIIATVVLGDK
jgi:two-component system chemotaxis response regulator CheY